MTDQIQISCVEGGDSSPSAADLQQVSERLKTHVEGEFGRAERQDFNLLAHRQGQLVGGLRGYSHWQWLYISQLWVDESVRSHGVGQELITQAASMAKLRHCRGIYVDTFSPRAYRFYLRLGFHEVGRIKDFPPGSERYYLTKTLADI